MAPQQSRKSKTTSVDEQSSSSEDMEPLQASDKGSKAIAKALEITSNNQKRRDAKRKAIVLEHEQRVQITKGKISTLFNGRKLQVTKSQRVLWTRLQDLNKRREFVEGQILASMKRMEKETQNIQSEISAVLGGRISDIMDPDADEAL